jgi:flavorubredoxin
MKRMGKNIAVIYQSHYSTTKQYAEWIAKELGADLIERKKANAAMLSVWNIKESLRRTDGGENLRTVLNEYAAAEMHKLKLQK